MATKKRLIDAMKTVTKISKRVTPLIQQGCHQQLSAAYLIGKMDGERKDNG